MLLRDNRSSIRGTPTLAPYWPWDSLPGLVSLARNEIVSWSESKDRATATLASPGHCAGASDRPALTRSTCVRKVDSCHSHGSGSAGMAVAQWLVGQGRDHLVSYSVQVLGHHLRRPVGVPVLDRGDQLVVVVHGGVGVDRVHLVPAAQQDHL